MELYPYVYCGMVIDPSDHKDAHSRTDHTDHTIVTIPIRMKHGGSGFMLV